MKQKLKRKIYLGALLLGLPLLFYQCKDDETITTQESITSDLEKPFVNEKYLLDIKAEDVEDILNQIATEGRGFVPKKEKDVSNDNRNVGNPFGTISSNVIAGLEDLEGNKTYTFKIDPYDPQTDIFYNFVVHTDPYGTIDKMYVKEYQTYNGSKLDSRYSGKVTRYDIFGYHETEIVFNEGKASNQQCGDCEPIDNDTNNNQDDGSTTGDGNTNDNTTDDPDSSDTATGGTGQSDGDSSPNGDPGDGDGNPNNGDSDTVVCDFEILVVNCGGTNSGSPHPGESCAGPGGPNNGDPGSQTYFNVVVADCSTDHRASNPGDDPFEIPLPCCDEDIPVVIDLSQFVNPCEDLKNLTDIPSIRQRFKELLTTNVINEQAFVVNIGLQNADPTASPLVSTGQSHGVSAPTTALSFAETHNHPNEEDYAFFSGQDVLAIRALQGYGGPGFNVASIYTLFLISNGRTFAVKFNDFQSIAILQEIAANKRQATRFVRRVIREYDRDVNPLLAQRTSVPEQQRRLYDYLESINVNVTFFEATYDDNNFIDEWEKVNRESLAKEPCN